MDPNISFTTSYCPIKDITRMHKSFTPKCVNNPLTTTTLQSKDKLLRYSSNSLASLLNSTTEATASATIKHPENSIKFKLNNKDFTEKSQIKPWLQEKLTTLGIDIVIERSDDTKIVFKCKYSEKSKDKERKSMDENSNKISKPKATRRKKKICPFRIRANYSIRSKVWTLVIVNDTHNHPVPSVSINDIQNTLSDDKIRSPITTPPPSTSTYVSTSMSSSSSIESQPQPQPHTTTASSPEVMSTCSSSTTATSSTGTVPSAVAPASSAKLFCLLSGNTNTNNTNTNSSGFELPPISIPDYDFKLKNQVKKIEDTIKDIENIKNIPKDSKEKIFNNVLSVLNESIYQASNQNATMMLRSSPVSAPAPVSNSNILPLPPVDSPFYLPLSKRELNEKNERIVLPSIHTLNKEMTPSNRLAMFGKWDRWRRFAGAGRVVTMVDPWHGRCRKS